MRALDVWDVMAVSGAAMVVVGIALYSIPAAVVVAGVALFRIGTRGNPTSNVRRR